MIQFLLAAVVGLFVNFSFAQEHAAPAMTAPTVTTTETAPSAETVNAEAKAEHEVGTTHSDEHAGAGHESGEAHGASHEEGIPNEVWFQFVNFALFAGLIVYFLRQPVKTYFKDRANSFRLAMTKAEASRAEAEKQKREIESRLRTLENSAQDSLTHARAEADELRKRIVREAQELSAKLKEDAQRTAEIELQRAKTELREEVLTQAVTAAKAVLSEKIAEGDQKRLQTEFVDKIQAVRS
jgi:F-type H+-transporting ATPase subunit b